MTEKLNNYGRVSRVKLQKKLIGAECGGDPLLLHFILDTFKQGYYFAAIQAIYSYSKAYSFSLLLMDCKVLGEEMPDKFKVLSQYFVANFYYNTNLVGIQGKFSAVIAAFFRYFSKIFYGDNAYNRRIMQDKSVIDLCSYTIDFLSNKGMVSIVAKNRPEIYKAITAYKEKLTELNGKNKRMLSKLMDHVLSNRNAPNTGYKIFLSQMLMYSIEQKNPFYIKLMHFYQPVDIIFETAKQFDRPNVCFEIKNFLPGVKPPKYQNLKSFVNSYSSDTNSQDSDFVWIDQSIERWRKRVFKTKKITHPPLFPKKIKQRVRRKSHYEFSNDKALIKLIYRSAAFRLLHICIRTNGKDPHHHPISVSNLKY